MSRCTSPLPTHPALESRANIRSDHEAVSLSRLPPELLCRVFESADDFSVVAALAQTARIFYDTWRKNPTSICEAVAPRAISNFADAEQLVDAQEEAEASSPESRDDRAVSRAKRLIFHARCAGAAYDEWVNVMKIHLFPDRVEGNLSMRPSEQARFEQAFYCVWTVSILARATHLQEQASAFLDRCSPRELCRLDEMSTWAKSYNENEFRPSGLDLDLSDETWRAGYDLISKRWMDYWNIQQHGIYGPSGKHSPFGFFAFLDHTQRYLDHIPDHW